MDHWTRRRSLGSSVTGAAPMLAGPGQAMADQGPRIPKVAAAFVNIYKPQKESYQTESPFLVRYEGRAAGLGLRVAMDQP